MLSSRWQNYDYIGSLSLKTIDVSPGVWDSHPLKHPPPYSGIEKSQNQYYKKAALEVSGQKKSIINKGECPTKRTPWYCEEVKELAQDKRIQNI